MAKGWDRTSIEMNTRPIRVERDVTAADLVAPRGGNLVMLLGACLACGLGLAMLFTFWTMMLVAFLGIGVGRWIVPTVAATGIAFAVMLYVWELRARRDAADELRA